MSSYREAVSTLHCALENGSNLHVNERQKIRHYRARSAEERRIRSDTQVPPVSYCVSEELEEELEERRRMPNRDFLLRAVHT